MDFSELTKKEVRKKAFFRCCRCQEIGVEVHHIITKEYGGLNDIDNAAPLCPNCHENFGNNPEKRKIIKEMRDVWYSKVKNMFSVNDLKSIEEISNNLIGIKNDTSQIADLRNSVKEFMDKKFEEITGANATAVVSSILGSTVAFSSTGPVMLFRDHAYWVDGDNEPFCSRCWEIERIKVHMHPEGNPAWYKCPNCKSQVKVKPDLDDPPRANVFYLRNYR